MREAKDADLRAAGIAHSEIALQPESQIFVTRNHLGRHYTSVQALLGAQLLDLIQGDTRQIQKLASNCASWASGVVRHRRRANCKIFGQASSRVRFRKGAEWQNFEVMRAKQNK